MNVYVLRDNIECDFLYHQNAHAMLPKLRVTLGLFSTQISQEKTAKVRSNMACASGCAYLFTQTLSHSRHFPPRNITVSPYTMRGFSFYNKSLSKR